MAYRLASKINRFLSPNKFSIPSSERLQSTLNKNQNSEQTLNVKHVQYKVRSIKSFTHGTQPGRCTFKSDKNVPFPVKSSGSANPKTSNTQDNTEFVTANLSSVQNQQATAVVTPLIEKNDADTMPGLISSSKSQYPDEYEPSPPKRFERSSTQNAITGPLKLPRLASPFPDPVKVMMSHETISDKEKADMMFEEVKMEQRFKEQYEQEQRQRNLEKNNREATKSVGHQSRRSQMDKRNYSSISNIFPPNLPTQVEQCERIINDLRGQVPDNEIPRKPLLVPGSEEEKQFIKNTMKFLARYNKKLVKKTKAAPFPSYSEVKTFVREATLNTGAKTEEVVNQNNSARVQFTESRAPEVCGVNRTKEKVPVVATTNKNSVTNTNIPVALPLAMRRKYTSAAGLQNLLGVRYYSEEYNSICDLPQKNRMPSCPRFVMKGCKRPNRKGCFRRAPVPTCRKQVAPYPSYSECMDPVYADDPTECTQCPFPQEVSYDKVDGKPFKKRRYSTATHFQSMVNESDLQQSQSYQTGRAYCTQKFDPDYYADPEPPEQCKSPKHKGTAARRTDRRIIKLHKPSKKYRYSTSAPNNSGNNESADVITKVREWLNAWRPDHENIRITARRRSPANVQMNEANTSDQEVTRESYEIEIVEKRPDAAMASAAFHPGEWTECEHGAPAGDLPAFVSEISGLSQEPKPKKIKKLSKEKGDRPVIEIREEPLNLKTEVIECSGKPPIPIECQKSPNIGTCDICGSPPIKNKKCQVTDGGCAKRRKQVPDKPCRSPIKRPLPACEPDCGCFSKINEEVNPSLSFKENNLQQPSMTVSKILKDLHNQDQIDKEYKDVTIDVSTYDRDGPSYNRKVREHIDNSAQILNVSMPRDGHEKSPPMKLKPQFWSKFTRTTTLPIKEQS